MQLKNLTLLVGFFLLLLFPGFSQNYLGVSDPQRWWISQTGTIEEAVFTLRPKGIYVELGLYLTFSAGNTGFSPSDQLEVVLDFTLPKEAIVIDSWLWVENDIIKAKILDRWTASAIYEGIVNRRRDPSLLVKNGPTAYQLRIYPLAGNGSRKVKINVLLPAEWTAKDVSAVLPMHILHTSASPLQKVEIRSWLDPEWTNPQIKGTGITAMEEVDHPALGKYYKAVIDQADMERVVSFSVDAPLESGVYVSRLERDGEKWYQMAFLPTTAFDLGAAQKRKVLVLLDYNGANSPGISQATLLNTVKNNLLNSLTPLDSFNLVLSRFSVEPEREEWLPADPMTIESVFSGLGENPMVTYSNLPAVLSEGIRYIQKKGNTGTILLFSNSHNEGGQENANQLLRALTTAMGDQVIPINICDFQNTNAPFYWINNFRYLGNEYFYTNLSRLTGGEYTSLLRTGGTLEENAAQVFRAVAALRGIMDVYTTLESGFCFSRQTVGFQGELQDLNRPVLQVGKYQGKFPFVVEVAGEYAGGLFSNAIVVDENRVFPADTLTEEMWSGNFIASLENEPANNAIIAQIVDESLTERVLSRYTAFIALEPGLGGEPCFDCIDESTDLTDTWEADGTDTLLSIRAFPNPFREKVRLHLEFGEQVNLRDYQFSIFNMVGQQVFSFDQDASAFQGTLQLEWNGNYRTGKSVASGIYYFVVRTPRGRHTLKLVRF